MACNHGQRDDGYIAEHLRINHPLMLCRRKALESSIFTRFISPLRTFRTKPHRHRRALCTDDEEEKKSIRTSDKENQERHLRFYKSMGQHVLANPRILDAIVRKSHVRPTDTVLEIRPGTGNLTLKILECAKRVVAVEIDKRMMEVLPKRVREWWRFSTSASLSEVSRIDLLLYVKMH